MKSEKNETHQNENEDIETALESTCSRLWSPHFSTFRDISISDRATVETIMKNRASFIDNGPNLNALKHVEKKKFMFEAHRLDKVLPNTNINDITELNDTILAHAIIATR